MRDVSRGSSLPADREIIREAQLSLDSAAAFIGNPLISPGGVDGLYGPKTEAAKGAYNAFFCLQDIRNLLSAATVQHLLMGTWRDAVPSPHSTAPGSLRAPSLVTADYWIEGVDVSGWQDRVYWESVYKAGNRAAYIKLTEDDDYTSKDAIHQTAGARDVMDLIGPYHKADPAKRDGPRDAGKEISHFMKAYDRLGPWSLPPAYDAESGEKNDDEYNVEHLVDWCDGVEARTGETCMVYTAAWAINLYLKRGVSRELLNRMRSRWLWFADYHKPSVLYPKDSLTPWDYDRLAIWQFAGSAKQAHSKVPGIKGTADRNRIARPFFDSMVARAA